MKTLGNKSLTSYLKKIITVIWYLEFLLLLTPVLVFMEVNSGLRYSWPVTLQKQGSQAQFYSSNPAISDFRLLPELNHEEQSGEQVLSFIDNSLGRKLLQTLHNLVNIGVLMFITWLLLQIFRRLAQDRPFGAENTQRIRWMGFAVLFLAFFDIIEAFLSRFYTLVTVTISGAQLHRYNYSFDLETFLLGLLLLILAEVFRRGAEYQTDSESIL